MAEVALPPPGKGSPDEPGPQHARPPGPHLVIALGAAVALAAWLVFGLWNSIPGLVLGVILLDFGVQSSLISNQHLIYALRPEARSRLTTVFMTCMFIGGALGSAGATSVWHLGGWNAVSAFGAGLSALALGPELLRRLRHGGSVT